MGPGASQRQVSGWGGWGTPLHGAGPLEYRQTSPSGYRHVITGSGESGRADTGSIDAADVGGHRSSCRQLPRPIQCHAPA